MNLVYISLNPAKPEFAKMEFACINKAQEGFSYLAIDFSELQNRGCGVECANMSQMISTLEARLAELHMALDIKDTAMEKMKLMNDKLKLEMRNKDSMRMSQLELLALRNLELENEIHVLRGSKKAI